MNRIFYLYILFIFICSCNSQRYNSSEKIDSNLIQVLEGVSGPSLINIKVMDSSVNAERLHKKNIQQNEDASKPEIKILMNKEDSTETINLNL